MVQSHTFTHGRPIWPQDFGRLMSSLNFDTPSERDRVLITVLARTGLGILARTGLGMASVSATRKDLHVNIRLFEIVLTLPGVKTTQGMFTENLSQSLEINL